VGPLILALLILSGINAVLNIFGLAFAIWWQRRAHQTNFALLMSIEEYARQVRNAVRPPSSIYDQAIAAGRRGEREE
jgi:uncharacterized iron-regulated membrane protein